MHHRLTSPSTGGALNQMNVTRAMYAVSLFVFLALLYRSSPGSLDSKVATTTTTDPLETVSNDDASLLPNDSAMIMTSMNDDDDDENEVASGDDDDAEEGQDVLPTETELEETPPPPMNAVADRAKEEDEDDDQERSTQIKLEGDEDSTSTTASFSSPQREEETDIVIESAAPRTYRGDYNEILRGKKYFIYSASGGFNNQREEMEYAMEIGRMLNRTVLVPMAGKHTIYWRGYEALSSNRELFPMDRIIDFDYLQTYRGVRVVPLNVSTTRFIRDFVKTYGENKMRLRYHPERLPWHKSEIMQYFGAEPRPLIYLRGAQMYHRWFPTELMVKLKKHVRYSGYLRKLAVKIANEALGGKFYAMHVRMGDYKDRQMGSGASWVRKVRDRKWKVRKFPIYVATEPDKNKEYFAPINQAFKNVTYSTTPKLKRLSMEFLAVFPPGAMRNDMLGLLEQLICAQAIDFMGTSFSTFSAWIEYMRTMKRFVFPEIEGTPDNYDFDGDFKGKGLLVQSQSQQLEEKERRSREEEEEDGGEAREEEDETMDD